MRCLPRPNTALPRCIRQLGHRPPNIGGWQWSRGATADGAFRNLSGETAVTYTVDTDDLAKFLRATATYTDTLGSGKTAAATTAKVVANPHTRPTFSSDTAARSVAENTTSGNLGAKVSATDSSHLLPSRRWLADVTDRVRHDYIVLWLSSNQQNNNLLFNHLIHYILPCNNGLH